MLVVGAGCSTTSTVSRISGPSVEGDIVGGSPDEIFVSNNAGGDFAIPRSDISEIDYPGNVHTLVGGIVAGYGVLNIVAGLDNCQHEHDNQGAVCTGVFLPAAIQGLRHVPDLRAAAPADAVEPQAAPQR